MSLPREYFSLEYYPYRRHEQWDDNVTRRGDEIAGFRGVDYAARRKVDARTLFTNLTRVSDLSHVYTLSPAGMELYNTILASRVNQQTVLSWLWKYEGFTGSIARNITTEEASLARGEP